MEITGKYQFLLDYKFQSSFDLIFLRNEERRIVCLSLHKKINKRKKWRWMSKILEFYETIKTYFLRKREIYCHTETRQEQVRHLCLLNQRSQISELCTLWYNICICIANSHTCKKYRNMLMRPPPVQGKVLKLSLYLSYSYLQ